MTELALLGGNPEFSQPFNQYTSIGKAEEEAVVRVVRSGCLSGFYGSWQNGFLGGEEVQAFEHEWSQRFAVEFTVSVNSASSGLMAAVGAAGIGPGDEVIVPATSMSATAAAPIVYGGIPVFADIDDQTFCLSLDSVRANLTDRTKAIIAVNLFGQAAPLAELRHLCDERGMLLIEDNAQGPLATENDEFCGTIGHIGVFSLNYHKHIHCGEGGMCTTNDKNLATRMRMIRNHAEAVVGPAGVSDLTNMLGFNLRLSELHAAVGRAQLSEIDSHVQKRCNFADRLTSGLSSLKGLVVPEVRQNCRHVYYVWALRCDSTVLGVSRDTLFAALKAEGIPCFQAYLQPLYLLPMFQQRVAIGREGFPFSLTDRIYKKGDCPNAERLYENEIIGVETCAWEVSDRIVDKMIVAFHKIWENLDSLAEWEHSAEHSG